MLMAIPILAIASIGLLLWIAASPSRLLYLLPVLLAFEYRVRPGIFSLDLAELCVVVVLGVWLIGRWEQTASDPLQERSRETILILALAACAAPSILFESNMAHAASVYRDLLVPFLFFFLLMQCRLGRKQIHALIKLAYALALVNACLGILNMLLGITFGLPGLGRPNGKNTK
jgi:hypothetical protein